MWSNAKYREHPELLVVMVKSNKNPSIEQPRPGGQGIGLKFDISEIVWVRATSSGKLIDVKQRSIASRAGNEDVDLELKPSIRQALEDLMLDVMNLAEHGGYIMSPDLPEHSSVIMDTLQQLGSTTLMELWLRVVGNCISLPPNEPVEPNNTPVQGSRDSQPADDHQVGLQVDSSDMQPVGIGPRSPLVDAALQCIETYRRKLPACQQPHGRHNYVKSYPHGPRDNGEYLFICSTCGRYE